MNPSPILKKTITLVLLVSVLNLTACGFFLYPERRGRTGGHIDPAVVLLDAACLIFFIVPGVIAFAVDIASGAIYTSKGSKSILGTHPAPGVSPLSTEPAIDKQALAATLSKAMHRTIAPEEILCYPMPADAQAEWVPLELSALNQ